jgi:hypothetical protein
VTGHQEIWFGEKRAILTPCVVRGRRDCCWGYVATTMRQYVESKKLTVLHANRRSWSLKDIAWGMAVL